MLVSFWLSEIVQIGRIHRADDANEAVELVTDQAVARGIGVDRAPRDGTAIERRRAIGRKLSKREHLETEMGRQLEPVCNARQGRQVNAGGRGSSDDAVDLVAPIQLPDQDAR